MYSIYAGFGALGCLGWAAKLGFSELLKHGWVFVCLAIWGLVNLISVIITGIHTTKNKYNSDRCKVEYYTVLCFIFTSIIFCCIYPQNALLGVHYIGQILYALGIAIYELLILLVGYLGIALKWIGIALWFALKYIFLFVVAFLALAIGLLVCALPFGLLGLLLMKWADKIDTKKTVKINKERKVTKDDWRYLLYDYCRKTDMLDAVKDWVPSIQWTYSTDMAIGKYSNIRAIAADGMIYEICHKLKIPKCLLSIEYSDFLKIKNRIIASRKKKSKIDPRLSSILEYSGMSEEIRKEVKKLCKELKEMSWNKKKLVPLFSRKFKKSFMEQIDICNAEIKAYRDAREKLLKLRNKRKEKAHIMCKYVAEPVSRFFIAIAKMFQALWKGIFVWLCWKIVMVKTAKGFWFLLKNLGILFVYIWVVVKHLKHGVCPYWTFYDPEQPSSETE